MKIKATSLIISIFSPVALFASTATCPLLNGIMYQYHQIIMRLCLGEASHFFTPLCYDKNFRYNDAKNMNGMV